MKRIGVLFLVALIAVSCEKQKQIDTDSELPRKEGSAMQGADSLVNPTEEAKPDVYEHIQTLQFDSSGYDTKVLREPLGDEVIFTVQTGDKIEISEVIEYRNEKKTYIKVLTPTEQVGYIQIGSNPYRNGNYSYQGTINVDGSEIKTLNISEIFSVRDGIFLKSLPSEKSENIHEVTHSEGAKAYSATAITSDYAWVRIELGQYVGWVPAKYLSVGRGGPTIKYPEAVISFDLIDSNQI